MTMANLLDKERLLLALRGQCREKTVKTAWVQELHVSSYDIPSSLHVEGFEPICLPIPRQVGRILCCKISKN